MKVVGADDAGWPVCKDCFRDVVRDAQCRAQIVVDPPVIANGRLPALMENRNGPFLMCGSNDLPQWLIPWSAMTGTLC